jgi:basic amino acid/polyamine antiporter, APA family
MLVMGGIIGSGIFMNPSVVAQQLPSAKLILVVWGAGGLIALIAGFIWAELAARRPEVGGQYAYLREAFHPLLAFLYGWALLLVVQSGGMAAVAMTFSRYIVGSSGAPFLEGLLAVVALAILTIINCLGVRAGGTVQSILMVLKIVAIGSVIVCGFIVAGPAQENNVALIAPTQNLIGTLGAAMVPVLFAYGGWQTATFVAGEIREPRRNLTRALILGVLGVVILYLAVNVVYIRSLGTIGLASTKTPATDVMLKALGPLGGRLIAIGIAISTFGFLSQSMLTAPRVYFAMAEDKLFFKSVGKLSSSTRVPVVAIGLQGLLAMVIALGGRYEQILNYVVSVDFIFFGATALCVFVFRKRDRGSKTPSNIVRVPGHPITTLLFVAACWAVVINTMIKYPENSLIGVALLLAGIPAFFIWRRLRR